MAAKKDASPKATAPGFVRLKAPDGTSAIGYEGQEFEIVDGLVDVPAEAAEAFIRGHGFTGVE
jgi:hypothetical protein